MASRIATLKEAFQKRAAAATQYTLGQNYGNLTKGGITNLSSGAGTNVDKGDGSFFRPTRIFYRAPLEILCVESWAANKFCTIPVDDMFVRWRRCLDDDENAIKSQMDAEREVKGLQALREAMVSARQYGSGFAVMMTAEAPLEEPLNIERLREGDLKAVQYFDRYDVSVYEREKDHMSPNYGDPVMYHFHPAYKAGVFRVHHSRVLRFDGKRPSTKSGFTFYSEDFGESELIPVVNDVLKSAQMQSGVAHMVQEASIPVLHVEGLRETIAGMNPDDPSPEQIGSEVNRTKSIYRMLMLDAKSREEFNRIQINFSGIAELLDRSYVTLAAAADIPQTRFLGSPPTGMDATGESDMKNYIIMMEAKREKMLRDPLWMYDQIMARHIGLSEPLEYEWDSLIDLGEKDRMEISKGKVEAVSTAVGAGIIDEDEARESLRGDWLFGELEGEAPDPIIDVMDPDDPEQSGGF